MKTFHLILSNVAGKLDERLVTAEECSPALTQAIAEFVSDIVFRDGDVIRVVEVLE